MGWSAYGRDICEEVSETKDEDSERIPPFTVTFGFYFIFIIFENIE